MDLTSNEPPALLSESEDEGADDQPNGLGAPPGPGSPSHFVAVATAAAGGSPDAARRRVSRAVLGLAGGGVPSQPPLPAFIAAVAEAGELQQQQQETHPSGVPEAQSCMLPPEIAAEIAECIKSGTIGDVAEIIARMGVGSSGGGGAPGAAAAAAQAEVLAATAAGPTAAAAAASAAAPAPADTPGEGFIEVTAITAMPYFFSDDDNREQGELTRVAAGCVEGGGGGEEQRDEECGGGVEGRAGAPTVQPAWGPPARSSLSRLGWGAPEGGGRRGC